jgi:START domain
MKRPRLRGGILCCALLAAGAAALAAADETGWTLSERDDSVSGGYELYRRQAPGEAFSTWRIEADLAAPPDLVWRVTLADLVENRQTSANRKRTVLRREGDVFWIHTEIPVALAADRDVVLRMERRRDPATGALRIEWRADPDAGPPPAEGVVRMVVSRGFWEFTSAGPGRTHARYESYAEPGGPFPAWLVDSISSGRVIEGLRDLRRSLAEAEAQLPPVAAKGR